MQIGIQRRRDKLPCQAGKVTGLFLRRSALPVTHGDALVPPGECEAAGARHFSAAGAAGSGPAVLEQSKGRFETIPGISTRLLATPALSSTSS